MTTENTKLDILKQMDKGINDYEKPDFRLDIGWHEIDRAELGYGGQFYPESWTIEVKSAQMKEIRYFSSIDEENPISVDDGIIKVLKACCRIVNRQGDSRTFVSYKNIYEHDRMAILFFIHLYTKGKTGGQFFMNTCSVESCGHEDKVFITPDKMIYKEITPFIKQRIQGDWIVLDGTAKGLKVYNIKPNTIRDAENLKTFLADMHKKNDDVEIAFVEMLHAIRGINPDLPMEKLYELYIGLESKEYSALKKVSDEAVFVPDTKINIKCSKCGHGGANEIRFPSGFRNLFNDANGLDELFG